MKRLIDKIQRSLSLRLSLWIAVFASVVFLGSLLYMFSASRETVRQEAVNRATQILDNTVLRVDAILDNVEMATNNMDWVVKNHLDMPDSMYAYSSRILQNESHLYGCSVAFEPYFFKSKGEFFLAYAYNGEEGVKVLQEGNDEYQYFCMDWYLLPKLHDKPCWTEPYINLDIDASHTKEMIISYGIPVKDAQDNFVGVISAGLSLSWLSQAISAVKPYPHSYSIMTGRGGTYLVHPDSTKLFYQTIFTATLLHPDSAVTDLGLAMQAGKEGMKQMEIDGEDCYVFYKPLETTGWSVAIVCPESDIFSGFRRLRTAVLSIVLVGMILMLFFFRNIVRNALDPLDGLAKEAATIASGRFDRVLPLTDRLDEIGQLNNSFSNMQQSLVTYIEQLKHTTAQKASIESELKVASSIQRSMLPKIFPPYPEREDIDIYGQLTSAKVVGGDLFDFYIRDEKLFFCIGDVSGKGVPASLLMTVTRSQFRTVSAHLDHPDQIVTEMNKMMADGNDSHMFVTLFLGVLDLQTGLLEYCNAGHSRPLVIGTDVSVLPAKSNLPVGILNNRQYTMQELQMSHQMTIFLYTDGLTEAENPKQKMFGGERMKESVSTVMDAAALHPQALVERLADEVHAFVENAPQSDDMTMLAIQWKRKE